MKRPGVISYGLTSYGYDTRLGTKFKVFTNIRSTIVDPVKISEEAFETVDNPNWCIIPPNSYILGESLEWFEIPDDVCAICLGKSTLARCGIIVNVTPGEPGWKGRWTIEISNSSPCPAKVYAGQGIMQVQFHRGQAPDVTYASKGGKYQSQIGLTLPKVDGS